MAKINVCVREDEYNKVRYHATFKIVDRLPDGEVEKVSIDIEQGNDDAFSYDYFLVDGERYAVLKNAANDYKVSMEGSTIKVDISGNEKYSASFEIPRDLDIEDKYDVADYVTENICFEVGCYLTQDKEEEMALICEKFVALRDATEFAKFLELSGKTMKQISSRFSIPYRTVQDWKSGKGNCPKYVLNMMHEIFGL